MSVATSCTDTENYIHIVSNIYRLVKNIGGKTNKDCRKFDKKEFGKFKLCEQEAICFSMGNAKGPVTLYNLVQPP